MKRWFIALAGILVMLGPGAIYSYSLFTQPLIAAFGWSTTDVTWAFALGNLCIGIGALVGGRWLATEKPWRVALAGTMLWAWANLLAGLTLGNGLAMLCATYGVLGGLGCGMAYIAVVSTIIRWFPTHRGFGGGLAAMGFGFGAYAYNTIITGQHTYLAIAAKAQKYVDAQVRAFDQHGAFAPRHYALHHPEITALSFLFLISGAIFVVLSFFSLALKMPPEDIEYYGHTGAQCGPKQALQSSPFYLSWAMLFLNATAGIIIISNAIPIMSDLSGRSAVSVTGQYAFLALFIGLGHLFWGTLSDWIGRKPAFTAILALQVITFFSLAALHDLLAISIAFVVILFCYGGCFGMMPASIAQHFGTQHFGANYGMIITAWGAAGIFGPLFVSVIRDLSGSYAMAFQPLGIMLMVAVIFPLLSEQSTPQRTHTVPAPIAK